MEILSRQPLGELVMTGRRAVVAKSASRPANWRAVRSDWLSEWLSNGFHDRACEAKGARNFREVGAGDPT